MNIDIITYHALLSLFLFYYHLHPRSKLSFLQFFRRKYIGKIRYSNE